MRIVRFLDAKGQPQVGVDQGDHTASLLDGDLFSDPHQTGQTAQVAQRLPAIAPANIFCIGGNYVEHVKESGGKGISDTPTIFMKPNTAVLATEQPILLPKVCQDPPQVDYECELAVVIGKAARDVTEEDALDYVLGYTCANDVSARIWQKQGGGGQWIRGKGFDTFCPLGPVLVTSDEITDPQNLTIRTTINGEVLQESNTRFMHYTVAYLISFMSQGTTLAPGTVILTGTPEGVGNARDPKRFLKDGDEVVIEIEGIGQLVNPVKNE